MNAPPMYLLNESFPDREDPGKAAPPTVPENRLNGGRYVGFEPPPGTPWGAVPVRPDLQGLGDRLRADGTGVRVGTYHYAGGGLRPGNHAPPKDLVMCENGFDLCIPPGQSEGRDIGIPETGVAGIQTEAALFDAFAAHAPF